MDSNYSLSDIAAVTDGNRGGMFGGGDWGAWIILFLLFGLFGRGGFGGFGGNAGYGSSPCATQADVRAAVDQQTLISKLDQQTYGLADSTFALNNTIVNGFHGVDNAICTLGYQTQQGFNTLGYQMKDCCCETQRLIERGFCDTNNTINNTTRDIIDNANCNTRAILDFLTQSKIDTLRDENQALRFQASQSAQNAFITANQQAQTAELIRRLGADCPTPAYIVQPPTPVNFPVNACGQVQFNSGCGCGNGYGYGVA